MSISFVVGLNAALPNSEDARRNEPGRKLSGLVQRALDTDLKNLDVRVLVCTTRLRRLAAAGRRSKQQTQREHRLSIICELIEKLEERAWKYAVLGRDFDVLTDLKRMEAWMKRISSPKKISPYVFSLYGGSSMKLKRFTSAAEYFTRAIKYEASAEDKLNDPNYVDFVQNAFANRAMCYMELKRWADAMADYVSLGVSEEHCVIDNEAQFNWYKNFAFCATMDKQYELALKSLTILYFGTNNDEAAFMKNQPGLIEACHAYYENGMQLVDGIDLEALFGICVVLRHACISS